MVPCVPSGRRPNILGRSYLIRLAKGRKRSMYATTRRILIMLLPCVAIGLTTLACPGPALAQQTFSIDFPKKAGLPNSCMTQEKGGSGGTFLRRAVVLPANVRTHLFSGGGLFGG